jgi:hypothetical protein
MNLQEEIEMNYERIAYELSMQEYLNFCQNNGIDYSEGDFEISRKEAV